MRRRAPLCALLAIALGAGIASAMASGGRASSGNDGFAETPAGRRGAPSVILVSLDTVRADHLSMYGYARNTAPFVSALASSSTVYDRAYTTCTFTLPSHSSVFTGQYPSQHGAISDSESVLEGLSPQALTLAEVFRARGYATVGAVGARYLGRRYGVAQGFTRYSDDWPSPKRDSGEMNRALLSFVERRGGRPLFLFVNYYDAHAPYDTPGYPKDDSAVFLRHGMSASTFVPEDFNGHSETDVPDDLRKSLRDRYDAGIRSADRAFASLAKALDAAGIWDDAIVCVFSDHGESFGEKGYWGHGGHFYEPQARVALLVRKRGGRASARIARPISLAEVPSMILREAGLDVPGSFEAFRGIPAPSSGGALYGERYNATGSLRFLLKTPYKYLVSLNAAARGAATQETLFDLESDPGERHPLGESSPALAELRSISRGVLASAAASGERATRPRVRPRTQDDIETAKRLRALGYLR